MYLYIHIPYCYAKCDYCDFFSVPCKGGVPETYIDSLLSEIQYKANAWNVSYWDTVYIGGGTPSLLSAAQLKRLLDGIRKAAPLAQHAEITVEMNPESLTREKLVCATDGGVNRLSLGIQSLAQGALDAVNRHCSARTALDALNTVRDVWNGLLTVDVIAGLPGQTEAQYLQTIQTLIAFKPHHFSLYTLTVEEGTPFARSLEQGGHWESDDADRAWLCGRDMLEANGYRQYEVSNFARDGYESVHNKAYWRQLSYLGVGAGACGTTYRFDGEPGMRLTNTTDIEAYTAYWSRTRRGLEDLPAQKESLSLETEEFEFLMMGLRLRSGVSGTAYRERFHAVAPWNGDIAKRLGVDGGVWADFSKKGYTTVYKTALGETFYSLSASGILFLNTLLRSLA